ncbi:ketoacyl-ACP synthase III [Streptomyces sp. ET3-23]|uniref:3-oxoacyl-ACP synthase III family protein n=1 Tax=Streptomyces sp. ET3-23 TaxID=2885643 RepID=UPI001D120443|nr:ketoacyl-ACP synthase III [Streptomyces sp. ET3-23]MCC2280666.1 ketoacyl-ACP synthase III [Streptomyces sp. ET3-23]
MTRLPCGPGHPVGITGLGVYRPRGVVTSAAMAAWLGVDTDWIVGRTGVTERGWADDGETVRMMAVHAARAAMAAARIAPDDVELLILATSTNPYLVPPLAPAVSHDLGMRRIAAFDVNAACAGWCYGVETARAMIASAAVRTALVVGSDRIHDIVDAMDRTTAPLFADGAGAAVLAVSGEAGVSPAVLGSDGSCAGILGTRPTSFSARSRPVVSMDGPAVARWAIEALAGTAQQLLARCGLTWTDIAALVPHQANLRLIRTVGQLLAVPGHVAVADDVRTTGNASSASVPLALHRLLAQGRARSGDLVMLIGFGAGMSHAGQIIRVP